MDHIPTRKTSEHFQGEIARMRYVSGEDQPQISSRMHAHRDDYYIFLLIEKGEGKVLIDFEACEIKEKSVLCIRPGQVHFSDGNVTADGWLLAVDSIAVREEYKEIFEKSVITENTVNPNEDAFNDLTDCAPMLCRRLKSDESKTGQYIVQDLLSSYIGMIAEAYQKEIPAPVNKRSAAITYEFKALLSANYRLLKRPSQYAARLNISPVYLYEAVRQTTGQSVGDYIRNEIMIQAKRLLFYSNMGVKEIALELGYEDWAYFTRMFTKISKLSPTQFRKKYLK
ncbi:MAG: AraC family transcriptional regulator [Bacteroidales bacterium]|jgi:AraC-like DNA-binding protein/mannose-6-phosphate isomerase-like protein (cupin superfamily)|nr:AraC family transcriptional regulator [Bacteroidales bacterium]